MRITFVHKTANFSGGNRVVATYAERLQLRGHRVCVVSAPDPRPRPLRTLLNRVKGRTFPVGDGRSWLDALPLEHRVLDRARPVRAEDLPDADVIVATWWETAEWVAALPPEKGAPAYFLQGVEWTIDDMPRERVKQTWRLPLHKIVIAEFMADIARAEFGDGDLSHVPNAVDTALFHAPPRARNAVPTVGFMEVGPLAIKGGDITRAALLLAKERVPELRAVCFGRSAPPPARALPGWVDFHVSPTPEALRALYASCDVFVHASRAEGFGLPLLEAMACRTPVAATPAGAAPELLPSGGGTLVPHDDPAALADALVALATLPPDAWRARSDAAHARATGYTLDDATQRMEAALQRAREKARTGAYARASARGDAGPAPELAETLRQAAPENTHGPRGASSAAPTVLRGVVPRAQLETIARAVGERPVSAWSTSGSEAPHDSSALGRSAGGGRTALPPHDSSAPGGSAGGGRLALPPHADQPRWLLTGALPSEAAALLRELAHPTCVAALEDALARAPVHGGPNTTGGTTASTTARGSGVSAATTRLLLDPLGREQGVFDGGSAALRRSFTVHHDEPPLVRRATLIVPLADGAVALSSLGEDAVHRCTLRAGDLLLVPAGLDHLLHTRGLRALLLPLYTADVEPDGLPRLRERSAPEHPGSTRARAQQALSQRMQALAADRARMLARARERLLGVY